MQKDSIKQIVVLRFMPSPIRKYVNIEYVTIPIENPINLPGQI